MSGEERELAVNLALSLVLHFFVFAGAFLTPSLYSQQFQVPVAYKVTLVSLPEPGQAAATQKKAPVAAPQSPKASPEVTPKPQAKPSRVEPVSPEKLALPSKRKAAPKRPEASTPAVTGASPSHAKAAEASVPSAVTGPGGRGVPGVVSESGVTTDNADPSLSYYLAAVQLKVSSRWVEPSLGLGLNQVERVTLGFTVLRSGLVRDIRVLNPSRNIFLDQSALRAVQEAVPLPPFPPLFAEETLLVRFHFEMRGQ